MTTTPDARSLPLATPCGTCDHARNWHNIDRCVVHSCGCGLFTAPTADTDRQAPAPLGALAGREQRRRTTANILARIDRAKHIQEDEAALLRTLVAAEQADGDQAREQLAAARAGDAPWIRAYGEDIAAERDAHENHRLDLAGVLGRPAHTDWQALLSRVQRVVAERETWKAKTEGIEGDLTRARRGEAEAVRAREAAEAGERRAMEQRQQMAAERFAWQERGDRAEISARAHKTAAAEALERAERAEQTLTAVRKAVAEAKACGGEDAGCTVDHRDIITAILDNGPAALGDPQPAEREQCPTQFPEGQCAGTRRHPGDCTPNADDIPSAQEAAKPEPAADPCVHGCRDAADDVTRLGQEMDAEPEPKPPAVCCVCGCPDVTYRNCNDQPFCCRCAMCCDPPKLCAHGCQPPAEAEHTCPDGEPCPVPGHDAGWDFTLPGGIKPAEPDWTVYLRRPCGEVGAHPAHRYTNHPYVLESGTYGCPGVASPDLLTQPAEPLLRGPAPKVHVHLDNRGAMYHPWPQEWRAQPTEGGKSEYRRNVEREAEQHVTVYGISVNEWDRLWLTVQRIADAAGVKPE